MFKWLNWIKVVVKLRKSGFLSSKTLNTFETRLTALKRKPEIEKVWNCEDDGQNHRFRITINFDDSDEDGNQLCVNNIKLNVVYPPFWMSADNSSDDDDSSDDDSSDDDSDSESDSSSEEEKSPSPSKFVWKTTQKIKNWGSVVIPEGITRDEIMNPDV